MKIVFWGLGVLVGLFVLVMAVTYGASELGGEVVTLERAEPDGSTSRVRVWIVDEGEHAWIEHGAPDSHWITSLGEGGVVTLERGGDVTQYRGVPDAASHARYHELRTDKYGTADTIVGLLSPSAEVCEGLPVRLETM